MKVHQGSVGKVMGGDATCHLILAHVPSLDYELNKTSATKGAINYNVYPKALTLNFKLLPLLMCKRLC